MPAGDISIASRFVFTVELNVVQTINMWHRDKKIVENFRAMRDDLVNQSYTTFLGKPRDTHTHTHTLSLSVCVCVCVSLPVLHRQTDRQKTRVDRITSVIITIQCRGNNNNNNNNRL